MVVDPIFENGYSRLREIYMKVSGSKYIFLVLYIGDILFIANNTNLLFKMKQNVVCPFWNELSEASYALGI